LYLRTLYQRAIEGFNETDLLPKIQDYTLKIISTNKEADELVNNGFEDFRQNIHIRNARERLDKGAIAFCGFVGKNFANIGWVATAEEAKNALTDIPFQVDFSNEEAFVENTFTIPEYRNKGIGQYARYKRYEYLKQRGATIIRYMSPNPLRPRRPNIPIISMTYGKGRYIKILWWKHWKETPIPLNT